MHANNYSLSYSMGKEIVRIGVRFQDVIEDLHNCFLVTSNDDVSLTRSIL
jgi:hypothetical protein